MAVVGHVEWVQFARVAHVPAAGEVVHARDPFEEPAGGGAVAAVQLARLGARTRLFTAVGEDEHGTRAIARLGELGVEVHAQLLPEPTRRAVTFVDDAGQRTITTLGPRLEPRGEDPGLDPAAIGELAGAYITAGDAAAGCAVRRAAHRLVASPRARAVLAAGVRLDAIVLSADDELEREAAEQAPGDPGVLVLTEGAGGGSYRGADGLLGRWEAVPPPGPVVDAYGCGDSFAAGFTFGMAIDLPVAEAVSLAARCGAVCATGHGPYERMLGSEQLA
jgi:ribokinase